MSSMRPIRILFVIDGFNIGGAERMTLALLPRLKRDGAFVAVFSTGAEGGLTASFRAACDSIESHPKKRKFDVGLIPILKEMIAKVRPDLIVSVLFYADVVTAFAAGKGRTPLVSWQHVPPAQDMWNNRFYHRLAYRVALPRFRRFICCADVIRDEMHDLFGVDRQRMDLVYNGVDLERFAFQPIRDPAATGPFTIGMVARFGPEKGQSHLIRALGILREGSLPDARLVLVGDGPTRPEMEKLARSLGVADRVEFAGMRNDVDRLHPTFDLVALTSECEAFPVSLLEAMACGRAIVASDLPGVREAVVEGETGDLFPVGDSRALADRITRLARDPRRRAAMGEAGRRRVEASFDQSERQDDLIRLFEEVCGPRQ
jgi:glycosyltransferase involved in cell wall biosynthesis